MKKRWLPIIFCALAALLLSGCDKAPAAEPTPEPIPALSYTQSETGLRLGEPYSVSIRFSGLTMDYKSEYGLYRFDPAVPQETRDAFVHDADTILAHMAPETRPEILVVAGYEGAWTDGKILYMGEAGAGTPELGARLITLACGGYANYGAAYGYAAYLLGQVGEGTPALTDSPARDMNWLCFREGFVSTEEIERNKLAAGAFARDTVASMGEEAFVTLLGQSGDPGTVAAFNAVLSDWYGENGLDYAPTEILYGIGGEYHDYWPRSAYARYYIPLAWHNNMRSELVKDENFLHESYEDVKGFFETSTEQMSALRDFFGFESYSDDLAVEFHNNGINATYPDRSLIRVIDVEWLMHEYTHWITIPYVRLYDGHRAMWADEGVVDYVSATCCPNAYQDAMYLYTLEYGNPTFSNLDGQWFAIYQSLTAGETDPHICWRIHWDWVAYYLDETRKNKAGYLTSFPFYVIDQIGLDALMDYTYETGNPPPELDVNALWYEWLQYLEDTYGDYPKFSEYAGE
ncbi:MAG: hypothetical protein ACI4PC_03025 [Oscillospiraceae bacterium]